MQNKWGGSQIKLPSGGYRAFGGGGGDRSYSIAVSRYKISGEPRGDSEFRRSLPILGVIFLHFDVLLLFSWDSRGQEAGVQFHSVYSGLGHGGHPP